MNRSTAPSSFSVIRSFRRHWLREVTAALLVAGLLLQSVQAVAPEWWEVQGVVNGQRLADDYVAANVGQLKNLAKKAAAELDRSLPGGAGDDIDALIVAWTTAPAPGITRDDYAALTLGQLKSVAKPFYDRLGLVPPWTMTQTPNNDNLANIGQLKRVFAFPVPNEATLGSTDNDGDGFSDVLEFTAGTNPYQATDKPPGVGDVGNGGVGSGPSVIPLTLSAVEGDEQTVTAGSQVTLTVLATRQGVPWSGVLVTFLAGTGALSAGSTTTDSTGRASVTYVAPAGTGSNLITAAADVTTAAFVVTVVPNVLLMEQERSLVWNIWSTLSSPYFPDYSYGELWGYDGYFEMFYDTYDAGEPRYQSLADGDLPYGDLSDPDSVAWSSAEGGSFGGSSSHTYDYEDPIDGDREKGGQADFRYKALALIADQNVTSPVSRSFLRIRVKTALADDGHSDGTDPVTEVRGVETLTITSGRRSNVVYIEPPVTEGFDIVEYLEPIEFEVIHTETNPATGRVVSPGLNTMLRDEIVNIRLQAPPLETGDWTMDLSVEPSVMRGQDLPGRGNVQMYDFGQIENDGSVTPGKHQFVLEGSAGGERTIKAVFNKAGSLQIRMRSTDGRIDVLSPEYTIKERIRKYAIPYAGFPGHDPNKYDQEFVDAVDYWGAFYRHPIDTVDRVKAMAVAESNVGAHVQNSVRRPHDILTIGNPGDNMLETMQGNPAWWDLDLDHPKRPGGDSRYKKLSYFQANIGSTREAIKWGVLWLYIKAYSHAPRDQPTLRTLKRNPNHTWERRNQAPYNVIEGLEEPEYQFDHWHTWDDATRFYNGGGDSANPTKVDHALRRGLHYYKGKNTPVQTTPIWPIRTDKTARP